MGDLRLGVTIGALGMSAERIVAEAQHAEQLGFHSIWTGEAWGTDAITPLTWAAAHTSTIKLGTSILQLPARTPAMTAMTAMTLDSLSGGRMIVGLGMSGPRVVEGWHGDRYGKPLARTREAVAILRQTFAGERVVHEGEHYRVPYDGPGATGLGVALRSSAKPRPDLPIYIAAIGPKNIRQTTEIADGLIPVFMSPEKWRDGFGDDLSTVDLAAFDVAPTVSVVSGDDLAACRDRVRPMLGLYIGGMGARGKNFYNDLVCRYGYEGDARKIQDLYLDGHRKDAVAAVPDALIDEVALVGSAERIADRLAAWRSSCATTLILIPTRRDDVDLVASLV
jgi:F420-dependent oxidoreductase-like protein